MTANPDDIARLTNDGVLLTAGSQAVKDADPNATDESTNERTFYFDNPAHGQVILDELFSFVGRIDRIHEAVETGESLDLGGAVPIVPFAPRMNVRDDRRGINALTVIRAYSFDMGSDRFALELVGLAGNPNANVTFDSTKTRFDNGTITWDAAYRL